MGDEPGCSFILRVTGAASDIVHHVDLAPPLSQSLFLQRGVIPCYILVSQILCVQAEELKSLQLALFPGSPSGVARIGKLHGHTMGTLSTHLLGDLGHAPTMKNKIKLDTLRSLLRPFLA